MLLKIITRKKKLVLHTLIIQQHIQQSRPSFLSPASLDSRESTCVHFRLPIRVMLVFEDFLEEEERILIISSIWRERRERQERAKERKGGREQVPLATNWRVQLRS